MIKTRGENDPFKIIDLSEIVDINKLPNFDFSLKWKMRDDRPPRRVLSPVPAVRNAQSKLVRQHSVSSNDNQDNKRLRNKEVNDGITETENLMETDSAECPAGRKDRNISQ